mmetsp:Transcript_103569/g.322729  ORF Transcript_103569/g.322729 Transcript_103569/m.322729 type:complete len:270 (-) Transcript_103569:167-976(-)
MPDAAGLLHRSSRSQRSVWTSDQCRMRLASLRAPPSSAAAAAAATAAPPHAAPAPRASNSRAQAQRRSSSATPPPASIGNKTPLRSAEIASHGPTPCSTPQAASFLAGIAAMISSAERSALSTSKIDAPERSKQRRAAAEQPSFKATRIGASQPSMVCTGMCTRFSSSLMAAMISSGRFDRIAVSSSFSRGLGGGDMTKCFLLTCMRGVLGGLQAVPAILTIGSREANADCGSLLIGGLVTSEVPLAPGHTLLGEAVEAGMGSHNLTLS